VNSFRSGGGTVAAAAICFPCAAVDGMALPGMVGGKTSWTDVGNFVGVVNKVDVGVRGLAASGALAGVRFIK